MSRCWACGAVVTLLVAGGTAAAQAQETNLFSYLNHDYYSAALGRDWLTSSRASESRDPGFEFIEAADIPLSLLDSFDRDNPIGEWTLFLTDLDFGAQGTAAPWGPIITAIPEPSAWALLACGGATVATCLVHRRKRRSRGNEALI